MKSKEFKNLEDFVLKVSNEGENLIRIKMQRKRNGHESFNIHPVFRNSKLTGINVEKRVMPVDTFFPISLFEFVISNLKKSENTTLKRGLVQSKSKIGDQNLEIDSLEAKIAMKFYDKKVGDSVDRRVPVVANILIQAGICEHEKNHLKLKR